VKVFGITLGSFQTNCYLVAEGREVIIIDPGDDGDKIVGLVEKLRLCPVMVVNTHCHIDHIGANDYIRELFGIPLGVHKYDVPFLMDPDRNLSSFLDSPASFSPPDIEFVGDEELNVGGGTLRVIWSPGHTPGSICIGGEGFVITGDLLFYDGVGRTDFPGGDERALRNSLAKIVDMVDPSCYVYTGHGPSGRMEEILEFNLFLRELV